MNLYLSPSGGGKTTWLAEKLLDIASDQSGPPTIILVLGQTSGRAKQVRWKSNALRKERANYSSAFRDVIISNSDACVELGIHRAYFESWYPRSWRIGVTHPKRHDILMIDDMQYMDDNSVRDASLNEYRLDGLERQIRCNRFDIFYATIGIEKSNGVERSVVDTMTEFRPRAVFFWGTYNRGRGGSVVRRILVEYQKHYILSKFSELSLLIDYCTMPCGV